jgi:hypothetical protein
MTEALSPELMARAVLLKGDFTYYAPRCLKVKSKAGQIVPFTLNRSQLYLHQKIEDQIARMGRVRVIVLKGRQQGISTYVEGRFYWKTSMNQGKRAYILTHLQEATDNLFAMTQRYHEHCPGPLKPHTKNQSAKALTFDKLDSEFSVATAGSKGTGRSGTGQYMHGSEVGFWDNAADHMAGIGQTIPEEAGTEIILESTGNGIGNEFHKRWQDAVRGKSDYLAVFIPWFWEPVTAPRRPMTGRQALRKRNTPRCTAWTCSKSTGAARRSTATLAAKSRISIRNIRQQPRWRSAGSLVTRY